MGHGDSKEVYIANAHPSIGVNPGRVRRAASAVLNKECRRGGKVNVILATDADLANLNNRYRGVDHPTDVLAFSMGEPEFAFSEEQVLGEVYVSLDRARQQAREYKVTLAKEVDRLVIHGVLHLCGYDHEDSQSARQMKTKEEEFLEAL
jgi:probable rRNA maturation factor